MTDEEHPMPSSRSRSKDDADDAPEGVFTSVDRNCGILMDGTIACWGNEQVTSGVPQGTFKSVSAASDGACAIRSGGAIACWGDEQVASDIPTGTFESVAGGGRHACAIRTDGTIACWGNPVRDWLRDNFGIDPSRFDPPQGTFTAIDIGYFYPGGGDEGGYVGAVRSDGTVALWGTRVTWECCG